MAKTTHFNHGDLVSAKKVNGDKFLGIYEATYDCGDHEVFDGEKHFCVDKKNCKHANEEEIKTITETILKPLKDKSKKKKKEDIAQEELEAEQPM